MLFNREGTFEEENVHVPAEAHNLIMEAVMMENLDKEELSMFLESQEEVDAASDVLMERTIVRLDKHAKLSKARKMAIFTIAKEKNDPKFKKLIKVWKMERYLEAELEKKYGTAANSRARKAVANAQKSKSKLVKKAATKAKSQFNSAPNAKPKAMKKPEFISLNGVK